MHSELLCDEYTFYISTAKEHMSATNKMKANNTVSSSVSTNERSGLFTFIFFQH